MDKNLQDMLNPAFWVNWYWRSVSITASIIAGYYDEPKKCVVVDIKTQKEIKQNDKAV
jgi:hypothetical protein